jgi:DNA topoisomerase-1
MSSARAREHRKAAARAGLRYVTDGFAGVTRKRSGTGWAYYAPDGARIPDAATRRRLNALAIPPAWTDVWICPDPAGHIQATARDARGRKQYRYHPSYREARDQSKFRRMLEFSEALPYLRERVERDLRSEDLSRRQLLATVVRLLDRTLIRVGNDEYARENRSFGLTTLRRRHVSVEGDLLRFTFRGKSGVEHSDDVNAYLREISGRDVTAKDFRTWGGSMLAAVELRAMGPAASRREADRNIVRAIEAVAERLGNTRAVCRKYYVHPALLHAYLLGHTVPQPPAAAKRAKRRAKPGGALRRDEVAVLQFLQEQVPDWTPPSSSPASAPRSSR